MAAGTIIKINPGGFGFIRPSAIGTKDVFFHCKTLNGLPFDATLLQQRVEFAAEETDKGPRAVSVRAAD